MLSISIYNQKLKSINKYLFGEEYDSDKNTKLDKIKQFQEVLTKFVEDHKTAVSIDDMRQFINDQKQNLSEIGVKDPEGKLLYVLIFIYENNDLDSVQDFLSLISDFDIQDVKIVFYIKYHIYLCYVYSQNCTYDVFKKAVDDLLSCNFLDMQTFKNFIDQCFSQDKDKKLIKQDCFNCIFELLKERFNEEKIKNIRYVEYLCVIIIYTFGYDVIKSADKSIFEYILNLTKNTFALGSSYTCFSNWFKVFSHFKAEFWNSSDLKDECWIAQYNRFHNMTLDFLAANSYECNYFYLGGKLTDDDIVIGSRESYKKAVQKFIANEHVLPETRFMIMYYCSQLYGTDTEFLKEISADGFSSIDSFFSNCERVQLKDDLADCLSVFSTNEIADFIKKHADINKNNRWKFLAIWKSIVKRCEAKESSVRITDFFPTPNDLFNFYKKIEPEFQYQKFLNIKDSKKRYEDIQNIYSKFRDLDVCLQKYDNDEIANFIKENNEPIESLFIWNTICERCKEEKSQTEIAVFFPTPKDLFDFYEKTHSQFLKTDISKLARSYIADGNYKDLCDCLKKYKDEEIASFMKNNNEPIESLFIWNTICERCKEEKSQTEIAVFFPGPKDLFDFYKKIEPEFSCENVLDDHKDNDDIMHHPLFGKLVDCLKERDRTGVKNICNILNNSSRFGDLMDCLKKYDNTKIADFIQKNDEPCESIFIWASLIKYANRDWCKNLFKGPKDIIDFYINKVPDKFKNLGEFYVFLHVGYIYQDTKLWQDYFKSILEQKNQTHIQLFLDLFDGKINLQTRNHSVEYNIGTIMENIFNRFDDLKSFLDFYIGIYSNSDKNFLETENNVGRDHILQLMINKCERCCNWDLIKSLLNMYDKKCDFFKYDFFLPLLINKIISKDYLDLCDLSYIVQFLSKKNDLDKNLKSKLLKKIDDQVESNMKLLNVKYKDEPDHECNSNAFLYPYDFQTKLKYVIEIMNSNEVLPETKKKIYDWAKDAIAEDEYKWQCVLEMYVYYIEKDKQPKNDIDLSEHSLFPIFIFSPLLNIIQQNPNNSNKNDKNNKYKYLQSYDIGGHSNLTTLKSHQGDWHLADLENSNELRNLNAQIISLDNQIESFNNYLSATEFKLDWILIIWLSGIGTIILLGLRYYWDSSKNSLDNTKSTLSTQKQNLKDKIQASCEKKKADYEDSLAQAKKEMKKWGKHKQSKNYPYDKHEKYCAGLKKITDIYEKDKNLSQNLNQGVHIKDSGGEISPLEEQQKEEDKIIYKDYYI